MNSRYLDIISNSQIGNLLALPHKHVGTYPTGFVIVSEMSITPFPFTVCPLSFCKPNEPLPTGNPQDVVVNYRKENGDLESLLYTLYETYKQKHLVQTEWSWKRFVYTKTLPPRKIIMPVLGRKENVLAVLKRFKMIHLPSEGYRPEICIVEHSPTSEFQQIASDFSCEYIWMFLDPRDPTLPLGQFNKALCYDKAFLFGSPAHWYLFHDNDVLVPRDFWKRLDENIARTKSQFLQPYTHRCLLNTYPEIAEHIRLNLELADFPLMEDMYAPLSPGAPGGSLYLSRQRYIDVGGHDGNYCWGYGPEDQMFFDKVKLFEAIAYADEPPIEMIHLWHTTAQNDNPFRHEMDWFVKVFFAQKPVEEKKAFMEEKKHLLESILKQIDEKGYSKVN
jgi:hypothetical protein